MAGIIFYEKPGCSNNTRQKRLLIESGHQLEARNLLTEAWSKDNLLMFFAGMPVIEWFNSSAPELKSGAVDPATVNEAQALELMINNPILIRRPLLRVADECRVGFDLNAINSWVGLVEVNQQQDMETCTQANGHSCKTP